MKKIAKTYLIGILGILVVSEPLWLGLILNNYGVLNFRDYSGTGIYWTMVLYQFIIAVLLFIPYVLGKKIIGDW